MGGHFSALGLEFVFTNMEILVSFVYLLVFTLAMFFIALQAVKKTVIT